MKGTFELDIPTLFLSGLLISILLGSVSLFLARARPTFRASRLWGWSILILTTALIMTSLRDLEPVIVSPVLADVTFILSAVFMLRAIKVFCDQSSRDPLSWGLVLLSIPILIYFSMIRPSAPLRVISVSLILSFTVMRSAYTLQKHGAAGRQKSATFTSVVLWLYGTFHLLRGIVVLAMNADSMKPSTEQGITLIAMMFCIIGATLGLLWMEIDRLQFDLERLASTDPLTGALNRRAFLVECEREISRCARSADSFALAVLDVDHFKLLNDTHGHPAGDAALRNLVLVTRETIRNHDSLARFGGEEFAVLMPGASRETAVQISERLLAAIEASSINFEGSRISVTASCGVAVYPQDGNNWSALLSAADQSLYEAKKAGRNRVVAARLS